MADDPIVAEIRSAREAALARFGYELDRYLAHLSEQEQKHPERVVSPAQWKKRKEGLAGPTASPPLR